MNDAVARYLIAKAKAHGEEVKAIATKFAGSPAGILVGEDSRWPWLVNGQTLAVVKIMASLVGTKRVQEFAHSKQFQEFASEMADYSRAIAAIAYEHGAKSGKG